MGLVFLLFLGLLAFNPAARRIVIILLGIVLAYMAFDNWVTERPFPAALIEVRNVEPFVFGSDSPSPLVNLEFDALNRGDVELESVDFLVSLDDCTILACETLGRKTVRAQLLAPPAQSRHGKAQIRFENLGGPQGQLVPRIKLLGGVADHL